MKTLSYNYGDGGSDGWREGDIYIDEDSELMLDLVGIEIYKNGELYMLFDDPSYFSNIGHDLHLI